MITKEKITYNEFANYVCSHSRFTRQQFDDTNLEKDVNSYIRANKDFNIKELCKFYLRIACFEGRLFGVSVVFTYPFKQAVEKFVWFLKGECQIILNDAKSKKVCFPSDELEIMARELETLNEMKFYRLHKKLKD